MFGTQTVGRGLSFVKILSGLNKTLSIANQVIPIYQQAKPMIQNAKSAFRVLKEFTAAPSSQVKQETNTSPITTIANPQKRTEKKTMPVLETSSSNQNQPVFFV